jgi:hypothetical protein
MSEREWVSMCDAGAVPVSIGAIHDAHRRCARASKEDKESVGQGPARSDKALDCAEFLEALLRLSVKLLATSAKGRKALKAGNGGEGFRRLLETYLLPLAEVDSMRATVASPEVLAVLDAIKEPLEVRVNAMAKRKTWNLDRKKEPKGDGTKPEDVEVAQVPVGQLLGGAKKIAPVFGSTPGGLRQSQLALLPMPIATGPAQLPVPASHRVIAYEDEPARAGTNDGLSLRAHDLASSSCAGRGDSGGGGSSGSGSSIGPGSHQAKRKIGGGENAPVQGGRGGAPPSQTSARKKPTGSGGTGLGLRPAHQNHPAGNTTCATGPAAANGRKRPGVVLGEDDPVFVVAKYESKDKDTDKGKAAPPLAPPLRQQRRKHVIDDDSDSDFEVSRSTARSGAPVRPSTGPSNTAAG